MDNEQRCRMVEGAENDINHLIDSGFLDNGPEWTRAWYRFDLKWSDSDKPYITIRRENVRPFVELAREQLGVFALAKYVAGTRLSSAAGLPPALQELMAEFLRGEPVVPAGKAGRKRVWGRDFIIINTMRRLIEEHGITPTCNPAKIGGRETKSSASEIMIIALAKTKIGHMDIRAIHKVWLSTEAQAAHDDAFGLYVTSIFDDEPEAERI